MINSKILLKRFNYGYKFLTQKVCDKINKELCIYYKCCYINLMKPTNLIYAPLNKIERFRRTYLCGLGLLLLNNCVSSSPP